LGILEGELAGCSVQARGEAATNQGCVEFGEPGLAIVVENENCIDHLVDQRL